MNLDRFSQGIPDPQDAEVITYCEGCGGEIYPGEDVYVVDGDFLHNDWECLIKYIDPEVKTIEEALGVEGRKGKGMLGKIKSIQEIHDYKIHPVAQLRGKGGRLGMMQMLNALRGYADMDGYRVETDKHIIHVLIDNEQSCCESWGYFASEDDLQAFIGTELKEINLTDKALNKKKFEESGYYEDEGGIQFVDFITDKGTFQFAVYNAHNGYYGHGIVVAKDDEILCKDVL